MSCFPAAHLSWFSKAWFSIGRGPCGDGRANQLDRFEDYTWLNHLEELNSPLWKSTFENEQSQGKALLGSGLGTSDWPV